MKLNADEKNRSRRSLERGESKFAGGSKGDRPRYGRRAKATFRKDGGLNIRLSSKDLQAIRNER